MQLSNFVLGQKLGWGVFGDVYAINDKEGNEDPRGVVKIEKVLLKENNWLIENNFAYEMGSKFPQKFIRLYDYFIVPGCSFKKDPPEFISRMNIQIQKLVKKTTKSKDCIYRLYERIDNSLGSILFDDRIPLKSKVMYSVFAQTLDIISAMKSRKWSHNDFHSGNLGVIYEDTNVMVGNTSIYNYGYTIKAIDYGLVTSISPENVHSDILCVITMGYQCRFFANNTPKSGWILKLRKIFPHIKEPNSGIFLSLCMLNNPELCQKTINPEIKEIYPIKYLIEKSDIIFMLKNYTDIYTIMEHFLKKLRILESAK